MSAGAARVREAIARWVCDWLAVRPATESGALTCHVGFSGGMDSTVLLHALAEHCRAAAHNPGCGYVLRALHLDHGLQAQSAAWRSHCQRVCARLKVPLHSERLPAGVLSAVHGGVEAAARTHRYRFYAQALQQPGSALLLAHHAEDQAETLLLRLLQGRGLQPMPAQRSLAAGALWRPLLDLPRADLASYAQLLGLNWIEDPSNASPAMDRNYLRTSLWPSIVQRWPNATTAVRRVADNVGQTEQALVQVLSSRATLPVGWCTAPTGVAVLRAWLSSQGEYAATDRALAEFAQQLRAGTDRTPQLRLTAGSLERRKDQVYYQGFD